MGRSPRVEPAENGRSQPTQPAPYANPTQPPQTAARTAEPATPPPPAAARPVAPAPARAVSESDALARDLKEGVMSGFLGGNSVVTGDADFKGMLRIDGHFTGHIRSEKGTLIVSAGGRVDADVQVATAKVNGVVNGDISATERVELGRTAQVRGDISAPALVVEQGAIFEGNCRMRQAAAPAVENASRPAAKAAHTQQPAAPRPAPAPTQAHAQPATKTVPAPPANVPAAAKAAPPQGAQASVSA